MGLTAADLKRASFAREQEGYSEREVQEYLELIARTLDSLRKELAAAERRAGQLEARLAEVEDSPSSGEDLVRAIWGKLESHPRLKKVEPEVVSLLRASLVVDDLADSLAGEPAAVFKADDLLVEARIAGEIRRAAFDAGVLDASAVSEVLGSRSANPRQYANNLRRRGSIIGLPHRNQYLYPTFQFDFDAGQLREGVSEVNHALNAFGDPWGAVSWWLSHNDRIGGRSPFDMLDEADGPERLVRLSRSVSEPIG